VRPGARQISALHGFGRDWTCASGWVRVALRGSRKASGRALWKEGRTTMLVTRQKVFRRFWYPVIPMDQLTDGPNPTATILFDMRTTPRYVPPAYLAYHQEATYVTSLSDRW
jgi:hypothetical protein